MTSRRKAALYGAGFFILLIMALALAPLLLRDRIEARVKRAVSSNIDAKVDWRRLHERPVRWSTNLNDAGKYRGTTAARSCHRYS